MVVHLSDVRVFLYIYANLIVAVPPRNVPLASYSEEKRYSEFAHQRPLGSFSRASSPVKEAVASQQVHSTFKVLLSHITSAVHEVLNGSTKWRTAMDIGIRGVETWN